MRSAHRARSAARLFGTYAAISLVPVLLLGVALAASYRAEARRRGVAEGRSEAALLARTAVEPVLDGRQLSDGFTPDQTWRLQRMLADNQEGTILRFRLRDMAGHVVFSQDGSGFGEKPDDEALDATRGEPVTRLTHLNSDGNDAGPRGVAAVEAYQALVAGSEGARVGVLEVYLPYAPIRADVTAGLRNLYRDLTGGLAVLYLVLFGLALSTSRGLRNLLALNTFMAEHDTLTGLPNRTLFLRRAEEAVAAATAWKPTVIAIIDLDRFKEVNDSLGHQNGDRLLNELAARLSAHVRMRDTVARLGGDEFGIVLRAVADPAAALADLRRVFEHEAEVSGLPLSIDASIGYAVAPADGVQVDELLQRSDVAMYVAKAEHTGIVRYDPGHDHYDAANLGLLAELRHAIDEGQLVLHYQPKADLADGRVEAVEALVRWQHPVHGLLPPVRFVPLAEQTDLIDKLTQWVLEQAVSDMAGLGVPVAVNVSARSLACPEFASRVTAVLRDKSVPASRLIVEITETALLANPERAAAILAELDRAGVQVSVDDFGIGHTSLSHLSALKVHELKIDRTFVSDIVTNRAHAAIVRSIIDLGHNLGLRVVGEGVETDEALSVLRQAGCDVAQGYLLARPMPLDALVAWLAARPVPRPVTSAL